MTTRQIDAVFETIHALIDWDDEDKYLRCSRYKARDVAEDVAGCDVGSVAESFSPVGNS